MRNMAGGRAKMPIEIKDLDAVLRTLNKLPKDASKAMRDESQKIAEIEAVRLRAAGMAQDKQSRLVAPHIRYRRDRVPAILAGGSKILSPGRKVYRSTTNLTKTGKGKLVKPRAGDVFFGAEFGGRRRKTTQQFRPHAGRRGYWFWPQLRADETRMVESYAAAVDRVLTTDWEN